MCNLEGRSDALLLGESLDENNKHELAGKYVEQGKLLDLVFNFRLLHSSWGAESFRTAIQATLQQVEWPTWVVSNHDVVRCATRWSSRCALQCKSAKREIIRKRMRLVALMLMTLRGTPV